MRTLTATRRRTVALLAVLVLGLALVVFVYRTSSDASAPCPLDDDLVPSCGVLNGAYVHPTESETWSSAVTRHEETISQPLQIVHFYKRDGDLFPSKIERQALTQEDETRILFANWKVATDLTWREIAKGKADERIRAQADHLQENWEEKFFLAIQHEPEDDVGPKGSGMTARDFRAMYRHVVDVFDDEGVTNAVWVMNYMGYHRWVGKSWFPDLYPGSTYVDWVAYDPYRTASLGGTTGDFGALVNQTDGDWRGFFRWLRENHPNTPVMLAEWGVGEKTGDSGWKHDVFADMGPWLKDHPAMKALVYFDNPVAGAAGNSSLASSPEAVRGYRGYLDSGAVSPVP